MSFLKTIFKKKEGGTAARGIISSLISQIPGVGNIAAKVYDSSKPRIGEQVTGANSPATQRIADITANTLAAAGATATVQGAGATGFGAKVKSFFALTEESGKKKIPQILIFVFFPVLIIAALIIRKIRKNRKGKRRGKR